MQKLSDFASILHHYHIDFFYDPLIDINIDINIFQKCRYIDNRYFISIYRTGLPSADLAQELLDFASRFKHWRVRLGFTQREVGLAVNCSQPKISNFENLNLSLKSMHKMKPKLENWLDCEQRRSIRAATFPPRL